MIYTAPHYYSRFRCTASKCPDTCCAGWTIAIDHKSLKKYQNMESAFGDRLRNSIDWENGVFRQYHDRCAFLNKENLCDIYGKAGKEYLCRTCRVYPRHIEEFEGRREISLCMSCMEAAELILGCEEPVRFITREDDRREAYEEFDSFLYTKLMDARELALDILRQRTAPCPSRISLCLGLAHDLQARMRKKRLYEADGLMDRYRGADREKRLKSALESRRVSELGRYEVIQDIYALISGMEVLNEQWSDFAAGMKEILYQNGREAYEKQRQAFLKSSQAEKLPLWKEQLMVYFVYTYFCGAVYNGNPWGKMKLAAASTLLIEELAQGLWAKQGEKLSFMDFVDVAHRFSREMEHSDENKSFLEHMLSNRREFSLTRLLAAVNS